MRVARLLTSMCIPLALFSVVMAEPHEIKLDRPVKVGDQFDLHAHGSWRRDERGTMAGRNVGQIIVHLEGNIAGRVSVLAVESGKPSKVKVAVKTLSIKKNGIAIEAPPAGTVIIHSVTKDGKHALRAEDIDLSSDVHKVLNVLLVLTDELPFCDCRVVDVKGAKAVGDSWPIDKDYLLKQLSTPEAKVDRKDLSGVTAFEAIESVGDTRCARLTTKLEVRVPKGQLPKGFQHKRGELNMKMTRWSPLNHESKLDRVTVNLGSIAEAFIEAPGKPRLTVVFKFDQAVRRTMTPIK